MNTRYANLNLEARVPIIITEAGVGKTGLAVKLNIQRVDNGQWWSGSGWQDNSYELSATERNSTDQKGYYEYAFTPALSTIYIIHSYITAGNYAFDSYEQLICRITGY
jgi:hypothetical protein